MGYPSDMKSVSHKYSVPVLLALAMLGCAQAVQSWGGLPISVLLVRTAELLTVQPGGPRLGRRPVRDDMSLVLFDVRTASQLGYVRSYADDLVVYQRLIEAGASVVYDTRSCAAATQADFQELRPLLEGMLQLTGSASVLESSSTPDDRSEYSEDDMLRGQDHSFRPRVLREVYLSSNVVEGGIDQYAAVAASNPLSVYPHAVPMARVRLYPLAYIDSFDTCESAPLAIARRYWELPRLQSKPLVEELYRSGILTEWHRQYPADTAPSEETPIPYRIGQVELPWHAFRSNSILVLPAGFWVSFEVNCLEYPRYSYLDILLGKNREHWDLQGKLVFIGYSLEVDPGNEIYEIPSGTGKACAAEVIALATQTVLDGRPMRPVSNGLSILVSGLLCLMMAGATTWFRPLQGLVAVSFLLITYFAAMIIAYRLGRMGDFAIAPTAAVLTAVLCGAFSAWSSHRVHGRVVDLFGRYVPRAVVNQLIQQPELDALQLGGSEREISVLFADIRGFTSFAEKLPPIQVVDKLNAILREMVECTFEHEGTLDKFIGDAILVLFNAPLDQKDHVSRAVRTAMDIQRRLGEQSSDLSVGVGLHVGKAVVGNIGTPQRMEYTAIGNTVNIASRLCDCAEGGSVILSQAVAERLNGEFSLEPYGSVQVKGLDELITIWRVSRKSL